MQFKMLLVAVLFALTTAPAGAQEFASNKFNLHIGIEPMLTMGPACVTSENECWNGHFQLGAGITAISLDRNGHIGILGGGLVYLLGSNYRSNDRPYVSITPIRLGPVAYQFTVSKRLDGGRGRMHMISLDVYGVYRFLRNADRN